MKRSSGEPYSIEISPLFAEQLGDLAETDDRIHVRSEDAIRKTADDPFAAGTEKVEGTSLLRRRKVDGNRHTYRIVYAVDVELRLLLVLAIRQRDKQTYDPKALKRLDREARIQLDRIRSERMGTSDEGVGGS